LVNRLFVPLFCPFFLKILDIHAESLLNVGFSRGIYIPEALKAAICTGYVNGGTGGDLGDHIAAFCTLCLCLAEKGIGFGVSCGPGLLFELEKAGLYLCDLPDNAYKPIADSIA